jgi:hypothetical protein
MTRALAPVLASVLFVACWPSSCQVPPGPSPATGGVSATGGTPGTGGTVPATGGQGTGGVTEPSQAERLCGHLAMLQCPEGLDSQCMAQIVELFRLQDAGRVRFDAACLERATTPEQARACGSILCGGSQ